MKHILVQLFIITFFVTTLSSQLIPKQTIVEHFTNTVCSVCANRNPRFYNSLQQTDSVLHIAYHPSSPYSSCKINQMNISENDARARYHNVYGSTPKFIVNGKERFINDLDDPTVYEVYKSEMTNIAITSKLSMATKDSITIDIKIEATEDNNVANALLFLGLVQDTLFYAAPNGEKMHFDIFIKSFSGLDPLVIYLPQLKNQTLEFRKVLAVSSDWDLERLYSISILNTMDKSLIQSHSSELLVPNLINTTEDDVFNQLPIVVFPNPSSEQLTIRLASNNEIQNLQVFDANGKIILQIGRVEANEFQLNISGLKPSNYYVKVIDKYGIMFNAEFIKE